MSLRRRLQAWTRAGLIDTATAERIAAFERNRRGPSALAVVAVLGGLTIGVGCISLVAANWDAIAGRVKIGIDLGLLVGLAVAIDWTRRKGRTIAADTLIAIDYVFVLASLGLVGQVYQLGTPTWVALLGWSLATAPMMLRARGRAVAYLWVLGLLTTYGSSIEPASRHVGDIGDLDFEPAIVMTALFAGPLLFRGAAAILSSHADHVAKATAFATTSTAGLMIGAAVSTFVWYGDLHHVDVEEARLAILGAVLPIAAAWILRRSCWSEADGRRDALRTYAFAWAMLASGAGFPRDDWPVAGALAQLALLALWAAAAYRAHEHRQFGALTAAIALRVLIIYFEVFGSLLDTGIGLVSGGALTLLLAYGWHRYRPSPSSDPEPNA